MITGPNAASAVEFAGNFFRLLEERAVSPRADRFAEKGLSSGKVLFTADSPGSARLNQFTVLDGRKIALLIASTVNIFVEGART